MTTLTFKVDDNQAAEIRQHAKAAGLSVSAYLRFRSIPSPLPPPRIVKARFTGAPVFEGNPEYLPLSNESVKEMLSDFP